MKMSVACVGRRGRCVRSWSGNLECWLAFIGTALCLIYRIVLCINCMCLEWMKIYDPTISITVYQTQSQSHQSQFRMEREWYENVNMSIQSIIWREPRVFYALVRRTHVLLSDTELGLLGVIMWVGGIWILPFRIIRVGCRWCGNLLRTRPSYT